MDAVLVPVVGVPASNSFGLLLVGVGLLCLGVGVGWWWLRTARGAREDQARVRDRDTPDNRENRSSEDTSGDTGGFVFDTDGNDEEGFDLMDQKSTDDAARHREE